MDVTVGLTFPPYLSGSKNQIAIIIKVLKFCKVRVPFISGTKTPILLVIGFFSEVIFLDIFKYNSSIK